MTLVIGTVLPFRIKIRRILALVVVGSRIRIVIAVVFMRFRPSAFMVFYKVVPARWLIRLWPLMPLSILVRGIVIRVVCGRRIRRRSMALTWSRRLSLGNIVPVPRRTHISREILVHKMSSHPHHPGAICFRSLPYPFSLVRLRDYWLDKICDRSGKYKKYGKEKEKDKKKYIPGII